MPRLIFACLICSLDVTPNSFLALQNDTEQTMIEHIWAALMARPLRRIREKRSRLKGAVSSL